MQFVERLLAAASAVGASDVHLQPVADGLDVSWRLDGVLQPVGRFRRGAASDVVARLKVLAELLTYKHEVPQEGRVKQRIDGAEWRVSTFPTLHGERAVVRRSAAGNRSWRLDELGLPAEILTRLEPLLRRTSGAILVTGPAGSGKTTTAYACLRALSEDLAQRRCLVSIEDPIEVELPGVAQSQVQPAAGFDLALGLRSILRQDPEVLLVGEIRDRETAEGMFAAALTGHLVLTTFHAATSTGAISRLSEMGIQPYQLRSAVLAVLNQRLVRRLCECAEWSDDESARLGLPCERVRLPRGCDACHGSGYRGRAVLAELLVPDSTEVGRAILSCDDAPQLEQRAKQAGLVTLVERAVACVAAGETSPAEIRRVLGF
ncbi:MAG TPA: GspE/PulE family protein [Pirellulaceae bacterium]|nr:GspE/PulE family protein [Pirellulaceae bacterium]